MKTYKNVLLIFLTILSIQSFGQSKVGHLNTADILQLLPEVKQAQSQLEKHSEQLENQVQILLNEYQTKVESYQKAKDISDVVRKDKETEIIQLEERIKKFQESAQMELSTKEKELIQPIIEKINKAVEDVAKEKGFDYILDTSKVKGVVLFANEKADITIYVKSKLGLN